MPYVPHTETDTQDMLAVIGTHSIDDLFREIPANLKVAPGALNLPTALDEHRLMAHLTEIASKNLDCTKLVSFLGAGIYDRYIPATVGAVISRGEFLTAYTPYQPEASQGYLQTIYEFQTMVAELYGMDLANASMYDGATSMAEAAIMATGIKGREKVVVSEAVHPHYRQVLATYCWSIGIEVVTVPAAEGVTTEWNAADSACIIVQYPNFFGCIENLAAARRAADEAGALLIVVADPIACALLRSPGSYGADVVVGEGQPMGIAMGLGGPVVGLFACKKEYVRHIPGRIVGKTKELHGDKIGYVMTLRTREQDIRREKATSNICTNEALMALAATVYMIALGKNGMTQVATSSVRNTQYAISALKGIGVKVKFGGKVFGEFVVSLPKNATQVRDAMIEKGFLAGLPLGTYYDGMDNDLLIAVTEIRSKEQIDAFVSALQEVLA
ncbi:MAG: aminomethyl-transferring glycine dehydrogenase subunit GcvPA [Armatimonadetes bacterium]|nr:aminomethyl-transferring glycine dehydrogenase subunit GcvPA [Armatimonadota bacterium]